MDNENLALPWQSDDLISRAAVLELITKKIGEVDSNPLFDGSESFILSLVEEEVRRLPSATPSDVSTRLKGYLESLDSKEATILLNEIQKGDTALDERLAARGFRTMTAILTEPFTKFSVHSGMDSIEFFEIWLETQARQYTEMRIRRQIREDEEDDLEDWIAGKSDAFQCVLDNFRAATKRFTPK